MANYKVVENSRQRSIDYVDGMAMSVGYQFLDELAYNRAKAWLERHEIKYIDNGYKDAPHGNNEPLTAHIIVTSYTDKDSSFVFEHIEDGEPYPRLSVVHACMVDLID